MREAFRAAAADTVGTLWPRLLRIVVRHLAAVLPLLAGAVPAGAGSLSPEAFAAGAASWVDLDPPR